MRFVIVTGMSGAGKSTALNYLEDADYYCVDNLPVSLIQPFAQISADGSSSEFTKFAVGLDIRSTFAGQKGGDALEIKGSDRLEHLAQNGAELGERGRLAFRQYG